MYYCLQSRGNYGYFDSQPQLVQSGYILETYGGVINEDVPGNTCDDDNCAYIDFWPNNNAHFSFRGANLNDTDYFWSIKHTDISKILINTGGDHGDVPPRGKYELTREEEGDYITYWYAFADGNEADYWSQGGTDFQIGVKIFFNRDSGTMHHVTSYWADWGVGVGGEERDLWAFSLIFYLHETCTYIAQVVDQEGNEKVWLDRYQNGWSFESGNELGVTKNLDYNPYGSIIPPSSGTPDSWDEDAPSALPLIVYDPESNYNGKSYAGIPISTGGSDMNMPGNRHGRTCITGPEDKIGIECETSVQCSGDSIQGVCMGIGKYCYDTNTNLTNGELCSQNSDCGEDDLYWQCRGLGDWNQSTGLGELAMPIYSQFRLNDRTNAWESWDALQRLQNLYAQVYGVWKLVGNDYRSCRPFGNVDCGIPSGDEGFDIMDSSDVNFSRPTISNLGIEYVRGNDRLEAPGGVVYLRFTANVNLNQLPLEQIYVDWGDGSLPDNPKGPLTSGDHTFYHYYTCPTNAEGTRCIECQGVGEYSNINGACDYPNYPKVNIIDHWGWCPSGSQSDLSDAQCLTNPVNLISNPGSITINPQE